ncbi:hypothetical protein PCH_Pc22g24330 [Penicillium rubens Wisconsin 54-1255]|uniref:Uncharacterized protein n=1 Tax=Penicillium rubens (strain ATCC 28089 / DSM 1075 / NRRL 1951 / Wisconsin 54-1255) TaxID=500485 RepID=B6HQH8_PENRW|nr:hypothetical protein PCH_Pc22g24330 [Penicillium rubens Wisconsin 54-1255]
MDSQQRLILPGAPDVVKEPHWQGGIVTTWADLYTVDVGVIIGVIIDEAWNKPRLWIPLASAEGLLTRNGDSYKRDKRVVTGLPFLAIYDELRMQPSEYVVYRAIIPFHKAGGMANHIAAELEKFCPVEACEIEWSTKYRKGLEIGNKGKRVQTRGGKGKKWQTGGPKEESANERSEPRIVSGSDEANTAQLQHNYNTIQK